MDNKFDGFYKNNVYLEFKNNIFNYLIRRYEIRKILSKIKPRGYTLEIGCGVSPTIFLNKNSVFSDISPNSVNYLKKRGHNAVISDITNLKFKNASFDAVVCSEVLEHVKEDTQAIKEIHRVLKDKGRIIITVPLHEYYRWKWQEDLVGHVRHYEIKEIKNKLGNAGFRNIKLKKVGGVIDYVLTTAYARLFFKLKFNKKNTNEKSYFIKTIVLPIYKIINKILFFIILIEAKITPLFLIDDVMVIAEKHDL